VLIVSFFSKSTRFTPSSFIDAVCAGSRNTLSVSLACGMAGIVIGVVTMTGLGQILVGMLMKLASHSLFLALFLTMISCIILGMGIPTTANYLIMALITAPMVISVGKHLGIEVPLLSAHMFVFYFGIVADITPPVALAAYAGSAIAHANPLKTGLNATRLAIAAFIIPYMFNYSPQMLFINATVLTVIQIVISSILGMFGLATGLIGYMWRPMHVIERLACIAGGLMLIKPGTMTDIAGFALIAVVFVVEFIGRRKTVVQSD
jgi:TRAP transporter 4TM/12TM fusion protein